MKDCFNRPIKNNWSSCHGESLWQGINCQVEKLSNGHYELSSSSIGAEEVKRIFEKCQGNITIDGATVIIENNRQTVVVTEIDNGEFKLSVVLVEYIPRVTGLYWGDSKIKLPNRVLIDFWAYEYAEETND